VSTFRKPALTGEVMNFAPQPEATLAEAGDQVPGQDMVPTAAIEGAPGEAILDGRDDEGASGEDQEVAPPKPPKEPKPADQEKADPLPSPAPATMSPCFPFCD